MKQNYEQMMKIYSSLSLNDKRNEFSSLLAKTNELINILLKYDQIESDLSIKNYNSSLDSKLTEDEMFTFFYADLWNIKNKLLSLIIFKSNEQ